MMFSFKICRSDVFVYSLTLDFIFLQKRPNSVRSTMVGVHISAQWKHADECVAVQLVTKLGQTEKAVNQQAS